MHTDARTHFKHYLFSTTKFCWLKLAQLIYDYKGTYEKTNLLLKQYFTSYECLNLSLPIGVYHVYFDQKTTEKQAKRNVSKNVLVPPGLVAFEVCVPPFSRVLCPMVEKSFMWSAKPRSYFRAQLVKVTRSKIDHRKNRNRTFKFQAFLIMGSEKLVRAFEFSEL